MSAHKRSFGLGRAAAVVAALLLSIASGPATAEEPVRSSPPDAGGGSSGGAGSSPASPAWQVGVDGQRILEGGVERASIRTGTPTTIAITFRNFSDQPLSGVAVRLTDTPGGTVSKREAALGDLAPQQSAVASFEVTIPPADCVEYFGAAGEVSARGVDPAVFKAAFPVACPGPRLTIEEVRIGGGDGDSAPEPGEVVTVLVVLRNSGADPATNVRGTMTVSGDDVEVLTGTATWPDIAPGTSAAALAPFTMRVSPDAKVQEGCSGIEPGIVVDPAPPPGEPGSSEPGAAADTPVSSDGNAVSEPDSKPADRTEPQPDQGVAFNALFDVTASDRRFGLEYSNGAVCAFAETTAGGGEARDLPARADSGAVDALKAGAPRDNGSPAMPLLAAIAAAGVAIGIRRAIRARGGRESEPGFDTGAPGA